MESKRSQVSGSGCCFIRAIVGMVPPGKKDINPQTNAIQSLIVLKHDNKWNISLLQNTPAHFHGHPELVEEMTRELKGLL